MLLETSDKTSNFGKKPHIKKGYYPGKLLSVEVFADKEGNPRVGKYGQQLIFGFEVWNKDSNDNPTTPLLVEGKPVVISKFVYHKYKNTAKDGTWKEGDYRTAITPNSDITALFEALGWTFSTNPVDPESFIGKFVELNINDYKQGEGVESYTASTINAVGCLITANDLREEPQFTAEIQAQIDKLEQSRKNLDNLKQSGDISEQGYADAIEQVNHEMKKLKG
jgi:hypothetical protein